MSFPFIFLSLFDLSFVQLRPAIFLLFVSLAFPCVCSTSFPLFLFFVIVVSIACFLSLSQNIRNSPSTTSLVKSWLHFVSVFSKHVGKGRPANFDVNISRISRDTSPNRRQFQFYRVLAAWPSVINVRTTCSLRMTVSNWMRPSSAS